MSRAAMFQAGLPACFWEFAARHVCLMDNISGGKESPYCLTYGTELPGVALPFGCLVTFFPAATKKSHKKLKWDSSGQWGVLAGYEMHGGY